THGHVCAHTIICALSVSSISSDEAHDLRCRRERLGFGHLQERLTARRWPSVRGPAPRPWTSRAREPQGTRRDGGGISLRSSGPWPLARDAARLIWPCRGAACGIVAVSGTAARFPPDLVRRCA